MVRRRWRAYVYAGVTSTVVLFFALVEWGAEKFVSQVSRSASLAIEIVTVLLLALAIHPVSQLVERFVEEAFNRRKHHALAALQKFRRELTSFSDAQQLMRRVIEAVEHHLETSACAIYLKRDAYRAEASSFDVAAGDLETDDPLIIRLRSTGTVARPQLLNSPAQGSHAYPMTVAGELVGFLSVHARRGDFESDENDVLAGLAADLGVALVALDPKLRQDRRVAHNLPSTLTAIVGRERERAEIEAALRDSRLVTLTGTAGVGKTLLALHVAGEAVARYGDGVWFVDLAPVTDPDLIVGRMIAQLRVALEPEDSLEQLAEQLRERQMLIVFDNCEQFVEAIGNVIATLLSACPEVTALATSREMLHLEGEQTYRVGSLRAQDAAALFSQRALAVNAHFEPAENTEAIAAICERLDGIPLAIELAAARVRALSAAEVLDHLARRFKLLTGGSSVTLARHRTLIAAIEWSFDLLHEDERAMLCRMSVFRGSFSLEAASAVSTDGAPDEYRTLDGLTSLVDKSLVVATMGTSTRYRLLESICEFAKTNALESGDHTAASHQHASYYGQMAAQAYHAFESSTSQNWLERIVPDLDNLRAALEWQLDGAGDRLAGAQLAADAGAIFLRCGLLNEGLAWADLAKRVCGLSDAVTARLEYLSSMLLNNLPDYAAATQCAQQALAAYKRCDDRRGVVRTLAQLAQLHHQLEHLELAAQYAEEALTAIRGISEDALVVPVLRRAAVALPPSEIERARTLFAEAVSRAATLADRGELSRIYQWWARSESAAQAYARALQLSIESQTSATNTMLPYIALNSAAYAIAAGDATAATDHARLALQLVARSGNDALKPLAIAWFLPSIAASDPVSAAELLGYVEAKQRQTAPFFAAPFAVVRAFVLGGLKTGDAQDAWARGAVFDDADAFEKTLALAGSDRTGLPFDGGDRVGALLG